MVVEEIRELRERVDQIDRRYFVLKGACIVAGVFVLGFLGYANWVQIPQEAKNQVPNAVRIYIEEERPALLDEIDENAKNVERAATKAKESLSLINSYESASASNENVLWTAIHAASGAACAATSNEWVSNSSHITVPHQANKSCDESCSDTKTYSKCLRSIAIGQIVTERATEYGQVLSINYNYNCSDDQDSYDEVRGDGSIGYTAYCCCYKPLSH